MPLKKYLSISITGKVAESPREWAEVGRVGRMPNRSYVEQVVRKQPFGWSYTDPSIVHNFEFEEVDLFFWHDFVQSNWKLALYAAALYIVTIFGLERLMRRRPAFNLKMPLFWWNLGLGVFSIIGFARTLPGLIYVLGQSDGFFTSICTKKDTNIATAYWTLLFILSKYVELGDTVFLVLRKKPVVFLQWYHHVVTMSVTWILCKFTYPTCHTCFSRKFSNFHPTTSKKFLPFS